jgi:hypothetical protein
VAISYLNIYSSFFKVHLFTQLFIELPPVKIEKFFF